MTPVVPSIGTKDGRTRRSAEIQRHEINSGKGNVVAGTSNADDLLANLAALQREVDAIRRASAEK